MSRIYKIISGGQTGADRGALQAAVDNEISHGGWCPKGRLAEDGSIPGRFMLKETKETDYRVRTEKNILDSDGTLIFCHGTPQGGTALTLDLCRKHDKPFFLIDLASDDDQHISASIKTFADSLPGRKHNKILNVAGSRESVCPGIFHRTYLIMHAFLQKDRTGRPNFSAPFIIIMPLLIILLAATISAHLEIQTGSPISIFSWTFTLITCLFHMPHFFQKHFLIITEIRILTLLCIFWLTKSLLNACFHSLLFDMQSPCTLTGCTILLTAALFIYLLTYRHSARPLLLDPGR